MTQAAAQVTTGLAPLIVGSTFTFQAQPWLSGLPWNVAGGRVFLLVADPNGVTYTVQATVNGPQITAPWLVALPVGLWTRCWDLTDGNGVRQVSAPEGFLVETSPVFTPVSPPQGGFTGTVP